MIVLGINGIDNIFHDASATLVVEGKIVASVEEERFNRKKHSNGLPVEAIRYCLRKGGIAFSEIDHIGYYLDPDVLLRTFYTDVLNQYRCDASAVGYMADAAHRIRNVEPKLRDQFEFGPRTQFHFVNHHLAHASSAFHISGLQEAAVLTVDGSGDRESSALYRGSAAGLEKVQDFLVFPESLGFIYTIFAAHLGLNWVSGPGKLMALAGYGAPHPELFADMIRLRDDCRKPVEVDLSFFNYFTGGSGLSERSLERFGQRLPEGAPLTQWHCDLAASVQQAVERAILHLVEQIPRLLPGEENLCLAGGVALNVTANRRILDRKLFRRFFVTPAAYDGGTSLGCALYLDSKHSGRGNYEFDVYCGPDIQADFDIEAACRAFSAQIAWELLPEAALIRRAADCLVSHKLIGWVQGRMEWGPRALGNRSILGNPMSPGIKDCLNARVKHREGFRPYAPAVLREQCAQWFDLDESPYMLLEAMVYPERRACVPGIVHVNGTTRPQAVSEASNPRFYRLIRAFFEQTGIPIVLNTSFNRHGEPIVNRPEEALAVLLETQLDELFIGDYHIRRRAGAALRSAAEPEAERPIEVAGVLDFSRPVVHNRAEILGSGPSVTVVCDPEQWAYAAAFRLNSEPMGNVPQSHSLLVRVAASVEEGRIGFLLVADDLGTVIGDPLDRLPADGECVLDLWLSPVPKSGWLVIRNDAPGRVRSRCRVRSVRIYRARTNQRAGDSRMLSRLIGVRKNMDPGASQPGAIGPVA